MEVAAETAGRIPSVAVEEVGVELAGWQPHADHQHELPERQRGSAAESLQAKRQHGSDCSIVLRALELWLGQQACHVGELSHHLLEQRVALSTH